MVELKGRHFERVLLESRNYIDMTKYLTVHNAYGEASRLHVWGVEKESLVLWLCGYFQYAGSWLAHTGEWGPSLTLLSNLGNISLGLIICSLSAVTKLESEAFLGLRLSYRNLHQTSLSTKEHLLTHVTGKPGWARAGLDHYGTITAIVASL